MMPIKRIKTTLYAWHHISSHDDSIILESILILALQEIVCLFYRESYSLVLSDAFEVCNGVDVMTVR